MKKSTLFWMYILLSLTPVIAQTTEKMTEKPYIDVVGSAEMEVVPDEIYVFIRLQERKQGKTVPVQEAELKSRLTTIGISLDNLSIKNIVGDYRSYKAFKKDLMTVKEFILKLNNARQLDSVFQQLDIIDVEDARIERLSHSKMPEFRKEVKINAIKAAKAKADYLLEAIGEQTGKPNYIIEQNEDMYNLETQSQYRSNAFIPRVLSGQDADNKESSAFQKIKIRFTISARFSIK